MRRQDGQWMRALRAICTGAVMFGWLQAFGALDFNQVWFQFLTLLMGLVATALFGDPTALTG